MAKSYKGTKTATSLVLTAVIIILLVLYLILTGLGYVLIGDALTQYSEQNEGVNYDGSSMKTIGWVMVAGGVVAVIGVITGEYKFVKWLFK